MIGVQALLGSPKRPQPVSFQAMLGSPEQTKQLQEGFADKLQRVKDLQGFVALMSQQHPGFFDWLYQQDPAVFETIAAKFKDVALRGVKEGESDKFTKLMKSLPLRPSLDPLTGAPATNDLFDSVSMPTLENCFLDISHKWLTVWPVSAFILPNKFSSWLSGFLPGTQTSDEDLKDLRQQALQAVYEKWLNADLRKERKDIFHPQTYTDFVALFQLVPPGFWYWQDPNMAGGPSALDRQQVEDYLGKRAQVWSTILTAWNGVRAHNSGWVDMPFLQRWTIANATPFPTADELGEIAKNYPDELKPFEVFRRSLRGRIWA